MKAITKNKLDIAWGLCRANDKSLEYTYQFMLDEVNGDDLVLIAYLEKYTDYYQQAYKNFKK